MCFTNLIYAYSREIPSCIVNPAVNTTTSTPTAATLWWSLWWYNTTIRPMVIVAAATMLHGLAGKTAPSTVRWLSISRFHEASSGVRRMGIVIVNSPVVPRTAMMVRGGFLELRWRLESGCRGWEESVATSSWCGTGRDTVDPDQVLGVIHQDLRNHLIVP